MLTDDAHRRAVSSLGLVFIDSLLCTYTYLLRCKSCLSVRLQLGRERQDAKCVNQVAHSVSQSVSQLERQAERETERQTHRQTRDRQDTELGSRS
mmetsp:Transcript_10265/g.19906  ORF Transcript_10265/g.19906 Transcript_10265/m.19906 type:complete len:95 (-) Transcript_10265:111-395(-)